MSDIIEGFLVGGSTTILTANQGHAVMLTLKGIGGQVEAVLSVDQSKRLRRLLSMAEKRAQ